MKFDAMARSTATAASDAQLRYVASCKLPTAWATFDMHGFWEASAAKEHIALTVGDISTGEPVLARVHSECLTGDALFSRRCDCGAQLETALANIAAAGRGILLYLRQEGRGIGLLNKIRAYSLQDAGADTVEANHQLGFDDDHRRYDLCAAMFGYFDIHALRLMTNNPRKIKALQDLGIAVVERIPLLAGRNPHNERYLATKAARLGHALFHDPLSEPAGHEADQDSIKSANPSI